MPQYKLSDNPRPWAPTFASAPCGLSALRPAVEAAPPPAMQDLSRALKPRPQATSAPSSPTVKAPRLGSLPAHLEAALRTRVEADAPCPPLLLDYQPPTWANAFLRYALPALRKADALDVYELAARHDPNVRAAGWMYLHGGDERRPRYAVWFWQTALRAAAALQQAKAPCLVELLDGLGRERLNINLSRRGKIISEDEFNRFGLPNNYTIVTPLTGRYDHHPVTQELIKNFKKNEGWRAYAPYVVQEESEYNGEPTPKWVFQQRLPSGEPVSLCEMQEHEDGLSWFIDAGVAAETVAHMETLLQAALPRPDTAPRSFAEITQDIARLHWWISQTSPFERGTAAVADLVTASLMLSHGRIFPGWENMSGDVLALSMPDPDKFVALFPSLWRCPPEQRTDRPLPTMMALSLAGSVGTTSTVRVLLHQLDPHTAGEPGVTSPLHLAAKHAPELIEPMVAAGADLTLQDAEGNTPLHLLLTRTPSDPALFKKLLATGRAALNLVNHAGDSLLGLAVSFAPDCVAPLIAAGAHVHERDAQGDTLLHQAIHSAPAAWNALLAAPVDVDARNAAGATALHLLCSEEYFVWNYHLRRLLEARPDVNARDAQGDTALHKLCSVNCDLAAIDVLLEAKADLHARNHAGQTPLEIVALDTSQLLFPQQATAATCTLLLAGAAPSQALLDRWLDSGSDALLEALLLRRAGSVHQANGDAQTLLHRATKHCSAATITEILAQGADTDGADAFGQTPLDIARARGDADVLAVLAAQPPAKHTRRWVVPTP